MALTRVARPLAVVAVICLAAGFTQPAKALGGGVVVTESNCIGDSSKPVGDPEGLSCANTNVTVNGYIVDPSVNYGYTPGQLVDFSFALNNKNPGGVSTWGANGGTDPYYRFNTVEYTALSGNTFAGSFIPANIGTAGALKIYRSGLVVFDIASGFADDGYTGLTLKDAPTVKPLVRYSLAFSKGSNFANVPDSDPGSIPTIDLLLAGASGDYNLATGDIVSNVEKKATYAVPGPLPILGIGVAFSQSRRLRKRIKSRQSNCC